MLYPASGQPRAWLTYFGFDRNTYLRDLDRFYVAIEHAARTLGRWSDKQYFLNTVYERFFQGYSVKLADTMGIVYTPQGIVDFMCGLLGPSVVPVTARLMPELIACCRRRRPVFSGTICQAQEEPWNAVRRFHLPHV